MCGGPWRREFRGRRDAGIAMADLRRARDSHGDGDITVEFLSCGDRAKAEAVLEEWARLTGYRRVWFNDRVIDLGSDPPVPVTAAVICPTCGARWDDGIPEFWACVREEGLFPRTCLVCGGELPQWSVTDCEPMLDPAEDGGELGEIIPWPGNTG